MAKVDLPRLTSGYLSAEKINQAFELIEAGMDVTLSRDGTSPNQLEADLDLNGRVLLNLGTSTEGASLVTLEQVQVLIAAAASGFVVQKQEAFVAGAGQALFSITTFEYEPGAFNLAVYVDGVRQFAPDDFAETSATSFTFQVPLGGGEEVVAVANEFLATVELPAHTHTWSQVLNKPAEATRWPTWTEVTEKPTTFAPAAHVHAAADITTGRLADARRGVFVQSAEPTGLGAGDAGVLWFW